MLIVLCVGVSVLIVLCVGVSVLIVCWSQCVDCLLESVC